uniref:DOG1 domain-containing protein n=1 Tax=Arundo donax TaxID=35708 RepID=A0A0A8ZMV2_ARUDO
MHACTQLVIRHAEPLTEQQALGVCGLQQWARDAEAALDHELQAMHLSVSDAVSSDAASLLCPYSDVPGYMATMSLAIGKLASLEAFVRQVHNFLQICLRWNALHQVIHNFSVTRMASLTEVYMLLQADALRLQTLHRLPQILTARQSARCFLAIADYSHRLRALSELWHTRPRQEPATAPAAGTSHRPSY